MVAAEYGRTDAVRLLLEKGADVHHHNCQNNTALDLAVQGGWLWRSTAGLLRRAVDEQPPRADPRPWTERLDDRDHDREHRSR